MKIIAIVGVAALIAACSAAPAVRCHGAWQPINRGATSRPKTAKPAHDPTLERNTADEVLNSQPAEPRP
jgi:hypothetical protein